MRIDDSNAQQLIKIYNDSVQTRQAIDLALLKKQQSVEKSTGDAILSLLASATETVNPSRNLDVRA